MRRICAAVLFCFLAAYAVPGCGGLPDCAYWESPCPEPLDVVAFCDDGGGCTTEGQPADCSYGCVISKTKSLFVPMSELDLGSRDELLLSVWDACRSDWPMMHASIDGIPGAASPLGDDFGSESSFIWRPFPSQPQTLEISFTDDGRECVSVYAVFVDATCEAVYPAPVCPL